MIWFILLCIVAIADGVLTFLILKEGGKELNSLMKQLMDKIGIVPTIVINRVVLLTIGFFVPQLAMPLSLIFAAVAAWNLVQYLKVRKGKN